MKKLTIFGVVGVASLLAFASVSVALATDSSRTAASPVAPPSANLPSASQDTPFGIAGKSWTTIAGEQLATLPRGTTIVDCSPHQKRLPAGAVFETSGAYMQMHPGLYFLSDGTCALDPNAHLIPMRQDNVDPKVP